MKALPFADFRSLRRGRCRRGFTMTELLVSTVVLGLVMVGVTGFFLQSLDIYRFDSGKLRVNRDIRAVTSEMTDNATYANLFQIHPSFVDRSNIMGDNQSGDFLLLIYRDPANHDKTERLVGYYRAPADPSNPNSEGPVRKFDIKFSPSSAASLSSLMPATSAISSYPEVIELSRGLSNGKLFLNFKDRSIMVRGEIIHRGTAVRRATNTYNFTISPRG